jgi:hypothetical protein
LKNPLSSPSPLGKQGRARIRLGFNENRSVNQKEQEQREHLVRQVRGKDQPEEWRDVLWLILFCIQLMGILFCAVRFGSVTFFTKNRDSAQATQISSPSNGTLINDSASQQQYGSFQIDYRTVVKIASIAGLYASILSTLTVGFMLILAKSLIQSALICTMLAELAWALLGLAIDPNGIITILGCCAPCPDSSLHFVGMGAYSVCGDEFIRGAMCPAWIVGCIVVGYGVREC